MPRRAAEITLCIGVTHTGERQSGVAIRGMAAGGPIQTRIRIVHILVVAQFDPAKRVHDLDQATKLDQRDMVDLLSGDVLDLVDQLLAAIQLGDGIDLHILLINLHQGIARNGNQRRRA